VTVQDFKKVGVVGLGLMGHGVAQIAATAGYEVLAIESNEEALKVGMKRVDDSLGKIIAKDVKKGNLTEAEGKAKYEQIMGKFTTSTSINDAKDCDLVIEAIAENMDLKLSFYKNLGTIVKPTAVLASNTSSLAITGTGILDSCGNVY
jgi:3-hydroxyacyl-CoA dehydrogenase